MEKANRQPPDPDGSTSKAEARFSATFTFAPGDYDEEFHRLNALIDRAAEENPGFVAKESWVSPDEARRSVVYYWDSREALKTFSKHPDHIEAKRRYREWYEGYEVFIAKVLDHRSDGGLSENRGRDA